jgi:hypothetical protein
MSASPQLQSCELGARFHHEAYNLFAADSEADLHIYTVATFYLPSATFTLLINKTFLCVAVLTLSLESRCFVMTVGLIISAKELEWDGGGVSCGSCKKLNKNIQD